MAVSPNPVMFNMESKSSAFLTAVALCVCQTPNMWPLSRQWSDRPDVRAFLQMDKSQNFSDPSEDEDDKVSDDRTVWCLREGDMTQRLSGHVFQMKKCWPTSLLWYSTNEYLKYSVLDIVFSMWDHWFHYTTVIMQQIRILHYQHCHSVQYV